MKGNFIYGIWLRRVYVQKHEYFKNQLKQFILEHQIRYDEPMKNHTSFRVGGKAQILLLPANIAQLTKAIKLCITCEIPYIIMGNGSNLLVSDNGIEGVVIKTSECLNEIKVYDTVIYCEAGVLLSRLSNVALNHGLEGLEFAAGIPGTLGGAVVMNAGAYGGEMKQVITETGYIDKTGSLQVVKGDAHRFGYRSSRFQGSNNVITYSKFQLKHGDAQDIKAKIQDYNQRRKDKQPIEMPSAGSVFRRPQGYYAGKLIEDCGLKGYQIGGAKVSEKHCGFIVNCGNATAKDVIDLIGHIKSAVYERFGVVLQTEVKVVGRK